MEPQRRFRWSLATLVELLTIAAIGTWCVGWKSWHPDTRPLIAAWCAVLLSGFFACRIMRRRGMMSILFLVAMVTAFCSTDVWVSWLPAELFETQRKLLGRVWIKNSIDVGSLVLVGWIGAIVFAGTWHVVSTITAFWRTPKNDVAPKSWWTRIRLVVALLVCVPFMICWCVTWCRTKDSLSFPMSSI